MKRKAQSKIWSGKRECEALRITHIFQKLQKKIKKNTTTKPGLEVVIEDDGVEKSVFIFPGSSPIKFEK